MLDTAPLQDAYRALLDAAAIVDDADDPSPAPQDGGWNADQILAHVSLVSATTIASAPIPIPASTKHTSRNRRRESGSDQPAGNAKDKPAGD